MKVTFTLVLKLVISLSQQQQPNQHGTVAAYAAACRGSGRRWLTGYRVMLDRLKTSSL